MSKSRTSKFTVAPLIAILVVLWIEPKQAHAVRNKAGLGLKLGVNKLDGDWIKPRLNPDATLCLIFSPIPYLSIEGEAAYSILRTDDDPKRFDPSFSGTNSVRTIISPIGINLKFNFMPLYRFRPFASIGGGTILWNSKYGNKTLVRQGEKQQRNSMFCKAGGGLEWTITNGINLSVGVDFRYTTSDLMDQVKSGDENDGLISCWTGIGYYFKNHGKGDQDSDNIPKELDLNPQVAEDHNGYMDHDGRPEGGLQLSTSKGVPVVIHMPVYEVEKGHDLKISANIISAAPLRTAAVLYRPSGTKNWDVTMLTNRDQTRYEARIKGKEIQTASLEYCVVVVDQNLRGIGYSGLPNRPIKVKVLQRGTIWRALGAVAATFGWGLSTYIILRNQS
jgi:hypothetical protein